MTKLSRKPLPVEKMGHYINNLWSAFTLAKSKEDIRLLFKDLFTHTEYQMFAKRLEIARQLLSGKHYEDIMKSLNVSEHTVAATSNRLAERGQGYRKAHESLESMERELEKLKAEAQKNLENPFRKKIVSGNKTVLGEVLKTGVKILKKKLAQDLKTKSARNELTV